MKAQLAKKYGKSFIQKARKNDGGCVNKMVYEKLLYQDYPSAKLVEASTPYVSWVDNIKQKMIYTWHVTVGVADPLVVRVCYSLLRITEFFSDRRDYSTLHHLGPLVVGGTQSNAPEREPGFPIIGCGCRTPVILSRLTTDLFLFSL